MSPETTTNRGRVVATITPESLTPHRYQVRCRDCGMESGTASRAFADGYAEGHVRAHGHTVEILERSDGPRVGVGDEGVE